MCLAVPGEVLEIRGEELDRTGRVSFGGVIRQVSLACVPEVRAGEYVLVHAGMAIGSLDAEEAGRVFQYLAEITGEDRDSPEEAGLPA